MSRATFGAQGFEAVEDTFRRVQGVTATRLGYVAGALAERSLAAIEIRFNPTLTTFAELLEVYWRLQAVAAPSQRVTTGPSRSSIVFYHDNDQRGEAIATKIRLERSGAWQGAIDTEILPASPFVDADPPRGSAVGQDGSPLDGLPGGA
jgi:peptide-methionine (S)-S-oxide reductase